MARLPSKNAGQQPAAEESDASVHCRRSRWTTACAATLVVLMCLVAGLPSLWTRDLWHEDEVRLTEGARELLHSPDGVLPRINGHAQITVPQLPYWATAILWKAGAGVASGRLLSVLSVVGMVLLCFFAVRVRPGGLARATMASAIALATMALFWYVRKGGPGPFWALVLTCEILAGYQAIESRGKRSRLWWMVCYGGAALAVLAVGVSAALLGALVLALYCLAARRQPVQSAVTHLLGFAVFAALITLWWAVISTVSPAHVHTLEPLIHDLAGLWSSLREGRLSKAVLATAAALFPWTVLLPAALSYARRQYRQQGKNLGLFCAAWLGVLALPAVLGGREGAPDYVIAIVPPLAILCAGALIPDDPHASSTSLKWPLRIASATVAGFTGLLLIAGLLHLAGATRFIVGKSYVCPLTDQPYSPYTVIAILPFLAASLAFVVAAFRTRVGRPDRRAWLIIVAIFLLAVAADLFLTPFINAFRSPRPFAEQVARHVSPGDRLCLYRKSYHGIYNLYTGRERIPVLKGEQQLLQQLARPEVLVIADRKYIKRIDTPVDLISLEVASGHVGSRYMVLLRRGPVGERWLPLATWRPGEAGSLGAR